MAGKLLSRIRGLYRATVNNNLTARETEFLPAALEVTETPPSPVGRAVMWTMVALVITALAWSVLGRVDEVAVAPGKVIPVGQVKVVQAEDKGVVKSIPVRDGQQVKQGQLLLELDPTISAADLARLRKEHAYYSLEVERLEAERDGRVFAPGPHPGVDEKDVNFQRSLFRSRENEYRTRLAAVESNVRQNRAALNAAAAVKVKYAALLEVARDKEQRIERLVRENAVALFVLLDHRARRLELEQNLSAQDAEIARNEWAVTQSLENLAYVRAEHDREIADKLVEDRKQLLALAEEMKKAEEKNRLSRLTSPVDGRVTQLAVHTVGGVVTAAQPLMVIVPADAGLLVEAWVANKDIGFVHAGQRAEVKIETFSFQKYGVIEAVVDEVSADAVEDKEKGRVYRITLRLGRDHMVVDGREVFLGPGMSATAEVKVRSKRIIEFFLDPFRQYKSEALRER
ncbi:HlyD family type I secretion periplasmic adaptor subunit [Anaeroselena agilis]|uniref:HlyD family type I secretion periplasmic adaptor subunit n=1 Tax=Anaeroselena agilis TaxID=3063788 RepID=A0ABU3NSI2_9FIRM|nr:HlyD family type I secretion periplasmic adaptor subunit [Selenomonadales bacterium 4137-cl]